MKTFNKIVGLIVVVLAIDLEPLAKAQTTSFAYQGRLNESGIPANGFYDFTFALYDHATNQVGNAIQIAPVAVNAGLFTVSLDFGGGVFNGAPRWLLIGVRTNGSQSAYTFLSPMQKIESAPYAIHAHSASNFTGNIADSQLSANIPRLNQPVNFKSEVTFGLNAGTPFYVSNAVRIPNLNADLLDGFDSTDFSRTSHLHSADQITSGTLADSRLSTNVAFSDRNNIFSGNNNFSAVVTATNPANVFYGVFTGNGNGLSNLNANYLVGTIQSSNLSPNIARLNSSANFTGGVSFSPSSGAPFAVGNSIKITNLNADLLDGLDGSEFSRTNHLQPANTITGILPEEILSTNVAMLNRVQLFNASNVFAGVVFATNSNNIFAGNGFGLQNINATNVVGVLSVITIPTNVARLNTLANFSGPVVFNPSYGAPFAVSNSLKVTNLNADLLDGLDSAAFASATHNHNAGDIASGTILDSRLSPNVALLNRSQQFSGNNLFSGIITMTNQANVVSGNGYGLTNLQSANIVGVIGLQNIPSGFARLASNQVFTGIVNFNPSTGAPFAVGNSNVVTNLNADLLDGFSATNFWKVGGNSSAANPSILGNTDNFPLELHVNNVRALRIEPKSSAPNIVGGSSANSSGSGEGVFIGGGYLNSATGNYAVVSGGYNNTATGAGSVVGGGDRNRAINISSTVPGGAFNVAGGNYSFAAGYSAQAIHSGTFVWSDSSSGSDFTSTAPNQFLIRAVGGVGIGVTNPQSALHVSGNIIAGNIQASTLKLTNSPVAGGFLTCDVSGNAAWAGSPWRSFSVSGIPNIVGGHSSNFISSGVYGSVISGGGGTTESNSIAVNYGAIGGGSANRITGEHGFIGGGKSNLISSLYGTISGGINNYTRDNGAAVGGGAYNKAVGYYATVSGGYNNSASNNYAVACGGGENQSLAQYSFTGGGFANKASGNYSAVAGGYYNQASNSYSLVGGGYYNQATNIFATVPGGRENVAGGSYSFASGYRARAIHTGSFVWSDSSSSSPFASTADNQFLVRAAGGVGIGLTNPASALHVNGTVTATGFNGTGGLLWLGTTDSQPLELKVNGQRTVRIEPGNGDAINVIAGSKVNSVDAGVIGATIAGGGASNIYGYFSPNRIQSDYSTIGGGASNLIESNAIHSIIGGGLENSIKNWAYYSTIGGGSGNVIQTNSSESTIGGGSGNTIQRNAGAGTISGGVNNTIQSGANSSVIGGGYNNVIRSNANYSIIAGGYNNAIQSNADYSIIIGGLGNIARDNAMYSVALGGRANETGGDYALAAGRRAKALHAGAFVWADSQDSDFISTANNQFLVRAAGGIGINTTSPQSGLDVNTTSRFRQRVDIFADAYLQDNDLFFRWDENHGLGWSGTTRPFASQTAIDGPILYGWSGGALGSKNGGEKIALFWNYSQQLGIGTVSPAANLDISTAAGESAPQLRINQTSTGDSARLRFTVDANYGRRWDIAVRQTDFTIYSGYYNADMLKLDSSGLTVRGTLVSSSDKNLKENFEIVNTKSVLEKLSEMPIHAWNFKGDEKTRHIGPTAQDFYEAFKLGKDETTIATVDADGVALAAIKALKQIVDEQKAEIDEKEMKMKALEKRIEALEKLVDKINQR